MSCKLLKQKECCSILFYYIFETYNLNYFSIFHKVTNFGRQNISKSILEVYFIFRIWNIAQSQQGKNTNKSLHNLWSSGLLVRMQVSQKTVSVFHPSKVNIMSYKDSWWLKVSLRCDSAAYRQLNFIYKVVHWNNEVYFLSTVEVYSKYT